MKRRAKGAAAEQARIFAAIAAGAALGALARHAAGLAVLGLTGPGFPWGTLAINVTGSFVIGFFAAVAGEGGRWQAGPALRHFVQSGFCGGFTTFSAFSLETLLLLRADATATAAAYVAASVALWLAAVSAGWRLGARIRG